MVVSWVFKATAVYLLCPEDRFSLSFVLFSCWFQSVIRFTRDSLIAANTKFCFDLFQKISTDDCRKNIFFCPLSLSAALGMVRLGARSGSARQIDQVRTALRVRAQSRPRSLGKPDCSLRPGVAGNCIFIYGARPAFSSIQPYFQAQGRPWLPEDACCVSPDNCSPVSVCLRACSATSVVSDSLQPH